MSDRFQLIKNRLSAEAVAKHYGFNKNKNGMINCIFHQDKKPSMIIDDRFYCLGCGAKGDAVDFVARMFGLSLSDAADKIISDFKLEQKSDEIPIGKKHIRKSSGYAVLEKQIYFLLCDYLHILESWKTEYAPEKPGDDFDPCFVEAITNSDHIEYLLDILLYGSLSEQFQVVLETLDKETSYKNSLKKWRDANERETEY